MTPEQQILDRLQECYKLVLQLYGLNLSKTEVTFDLKGAAAGVAGYDEEGKLFLRFNRDMLQRAAFKHVKDETVPHEVAHLVCYVKPELGRNHDQGWARVCIALGGNGTCCHDQEVVYGKGNTYEYTTTHGKKVRVSQASHGKIQFKSATYSYRGLGIVNKSCAYSIVGVRGRTLAIPVVQKAVADMPANHPRVIEEHVRKEATSTKTEPVFPTGISKASIARSVMLAGHKRGCNYEEIVQAIMQCTGHDRQLSRAYYKGNWQKVGVPEPM